ncbi:hypothetical protein [Terriglobus roseus]|uniref:Uncharacterized protein n=1 Tax=Terriglobus roseus TaxID=392734 RepID=A0A1G7M385_9BACT|nr:hypothetical protein [Terriglobus roseus]SDF56101.1 hypothetical protein SAMN05444167_2686 [Terriglobus roseus]
MAGLELGGTVLHLPMPKLTRPLLTSLILCVSVSIGCTREVHVEVPAGFHGHVEIICGEVEQDQDSIIRVGESGTMSGVSCPARQGHLLIARPNGQPIQTREIWSTTGDGIVREISFDVP